MRRRAREASGRCALIVIASRYAAVAAAVLLPVSAGGQVPRPPDLGAVRGIVFDSLAARPLPGARVRTADGARATLADDRGRFFLDSIAPRSGVLILAEHPAADSIGLTTLAVTTTVEAGRIASVTIGIPSFATLRRAACRDLPDAGDEEGGILFGTIRDALSGAALGGARTTVTWRTLGQQAGSRLPLVGSAELDAIADGNGTYYACGLPTSSALLVRAHDAADVSNSGIIPVTIGSRGILRRDLLVGTSSRAVVVARAIDRDGSPLSGARISLDEVAMRTTDDAGRAMLRGIPSGTRVLTMRRVGFTPTTHIIDVGAGDTVYVALTADPLPQQLGTVHVGALSVELEQRRQSGVGYVMTGEELERAHTMDFAIPFIPSVRVDRKGGSLNPRVMMRSRLARTECEALVLIDGRRVLMRELFMFAPSDLIGVEVYPNIEDAPAKYLRPTDYVQGCGVVLAWTKRDG